jgi:hypothetical protein
MRKLVVCFVAMTLLGSTSAWAGGGGGTKADATIIVTNNSAQVAAVMVDPTPAFIAATTPEEVKAAGGKMLNPGHHFDFRVKSGKHVVGGAFTSVVPPVPFGGEYSVGKGKTLKVRITDIPVLP